MFGDDRFNSVDESSLVAGEETDELPLPTAVEQHEDLHVTLGCGLEVDATRLKDNINSRS